MAENDSKPTAESPGVLAAMTLFDRAKLEVDRSNPMSWKIEGKFRYSPGSTAWHSADGQEQGYGASTLVVVAARRKAQREHDAAVREQLGG